MVHRHDTKMSLFLGGFPRGQFIQRRGHFGNSRGHFEIIRGQLWKKQEQLIFSEPIHFVLQYIFNFSKISLCLMGARPRRGRGLNLKFCLRSNRYKTRLLLLNSVPTKSWSQLHDPNSFFWALIRWDYDLSPRNISIFYMHPASEIFQNFEPTLLVPILTKNKEGQNFDQLNFWICYKDFRRITL